MSGAQLVVAAPGVSADRRLAARVQLGITGDTSARDDADADHPAETRRYPVIALGALALAAGLPTAALAVLAARISMSTGWSTGAVSAAIAGQAAALTLAPLAVAALARRPGRRAPFCLAGAATWTLATALCAFAGSMAALVGLFTLIGVAVATVPALHTAMLADAYPPAARVRVMTQYQIIATGALVLGAPLTLALDGAAVLSWRAILLVVAAVSLLLTLVAVRLRNPAVGAFDTARLLADGDVGASDATELTFFEVARRLLLVPTIQRLLAGLAAFAVMLTPFLGYLSEYLDYRGHWGAGARAAYLSGVGVLSIVALAAFARPAQRLLRRDPGRVASLAGWLLAGAGAAALLGAVMGTFYVGVVLFAVAVALAALIAPSTNALALSIIDARFRPHLASLIALAVGAGAVAGFTNLGALDTRFGVSVALGSVILPCLLGSWCFRSAAAHVGADLDHTIDVLLETQDIERLRAQGQRVAMLSCRGVDFSYGLLQVLFGVNLTVDDGEMVALLGTNGAGKSTLLKVISGIGLPSRGTVRFQGEDITYLDAERRVSRGISQVPGGRAVVGQLDVIENLRGFAYTLGRRRSDVDEAIERCLQAFPRLGERRHSLAATLSGGEQQMLGLCKALILKPRVLLIDELSLGLAPVIVEQLLDIVRRINDDGTAVVLVEQSVNIALSLVQHAYFMEKGEIRFDGPADDLLGRDDLLRAVFLEGATAGAGR